MASSSRRNGKKRKNNKPIALFVLFFTLFIFLLLIVVFEQKPQTISQRAQASMPTLVRNEVVATDAFGDGSSYVPNGWGYHKTRIIRTSTDDIFVSYLKPGKQYSVMHRPPAGGWTQVNTGASGSEPVNILLGPNNEIHVFPFPNNGGTLNDVMSKDNGATFTTTPVATGKWETGQGYAGAGTNAAGNMVVFQTENDPPYQFWWANYTPSSGQWAFHTDTPPSGYSYVYVVPGASDLSVLGMRDVHWATLGYPASGTFDYVFNELRLFTYSSLATPTMQSVSLKEELPQSGAPNEILYALDTYLDTQNRLHLLYWDANDKSDHHAIIQNNAIAKDVKLAVTAPWKVRMIQDTAGRFYFISTDNSTLNIYPGSATDTDGTQLDPVVSLSLGSNAACNDDWDFCLPVTLANPRSGVPLSNYVDGIYGNMAKVYYFRVQLSNASSTTTGSPTTSAISPTFVCAGSTNGICPTTTLAVTSGQTTTTTPITSTPIGSGTVIPTDLPFISIAPCGTTQSVTAALQVTREKHGHHKNNGGGNNNNSNSGLLNDLLNLFNQLIMLIEKLLGISPTTPITLPIGSPTITPCPSTTPSSTTSATPSQ